MKQQPDITIVNAWICSVSESDIIPLFGDIRISAGRIVNIKRKKFAIDLSSRERSAGIVLNAAGRVVTVPMINFHDHFYSRLAKGLPGMGPTDSFVQILKNLWWKVDAALDLQMIRASAQMAALESIRNGVTYIFDHHSSPDTAEGSLKAIAGVLKEFGLRGVLCFETTDRNGTELSEKGIFENLNFFIDQADPDIKSMLGMHASFTLKDRTLNKASELLKKYDLGIHIHLCESEIDSLESLKHFSRNPVDRLLKYGLLNPKSILAHGVYLSAREYGLIDKQGCVLAYCPDSNLNNGVGIPPLNIARNIVTGTDGMNSNPARSLKQIFLLSRNNRLSFGKAFKLVHSIYFNQLAFVRRYFADFPLLGINDRADLIIWDYIPPTPLLTDNFWGHFIYGMLDRPVHSVIQGGKILMDNFNLNIDETPYQKNIVKEGNRLYNKLSQKINKN